MTGSTQATKRKDDFNAPIAEVSVRGLFGRYDHALSFGPGGRCIVAIGPNGIGKTAILRMLHALLSGEPTTLLKYTFSEFVLTLTDGSIIRASRDSANDVKLSALEASVTTEERTFRLNAGDKLGYVERNFPALKNLRASHPAQILGTERLSDRASVFTLGAPQGDPLGGASYQLRGLLQHGASQYLMNAHRVERTFPERYFDPRLPVAPRDQLPDLIAATNRGFRQLQRVGFTLGPTELSLPSGVDSLDDSQARFLALFAADAAEKLRSITQLLNTVDALTEMLEAWLDDKTVSVGADTGLVIRDRATGRVPPLDQLSSGERHVVIMWYELLFNTPTGALVLIDEPEISWHVSWQKRFLDDLLRTAALSDFSSIVATHSPYIVGDHHELVRELTRAP